LLKNYNIRMNSVQLTVIDKVLKIFFTVGINIISKGHCSQSLTLTRDVCITVEDVILKT
jgi:hypothetical protein